MFIIFRQPLSISTAQYSPQVFTFCVVLLFLSADKCEDSDWIFLLGKDCFFFDHVDMFHLCLHEWLRNNVQLKELDDDDLG